jgi:hypothetical protein
MSAYEDSARDRREFVAERADAILGLLIEIHTILAEGDDLRDLQTLEPEIGALLAELEP